MDFRSTSCVFLGYSTSRHGHRCLDPSSDHIYIARHVRFNENIFPFTSNHTPSPVANKPYVSSYPDPHSIPPLNTTPHNHNHNSPKQQPPTLDTPQPTDPLLQTYQRKRQTSVDSQHVPFSSSYETFQQSTSASAVSVTTRNFHSVQTISNQ